MLGAAMARKADRDLEKEKEEREKQEREDRLNREAHDEAVRQEKAIRREIRDREERTRPERVKDADKPKNPRPGQLVHVIDKRNYLRFNDVEAEWEEVERHRKCDHWIRKGDPVELHVHECQGNKTPTVVFQCSTCQSKYRITREEASFFLRNHKNECPTCATPYGEDQPRDAIEKDFR